MNPQNNNVAIRGTVSIAINRIKTKVRRRLMRFRHAQRGLGVAATIDEINDETMSNGVSISSTLDSIALQTLQHLKKPLIISGLNVLKVAEFLAINKKVLILIMLLL